MKLTLLLLFFTLVGCTGLIARKVDLSDKSIEALKPAKAISRSDKFLSCILQLNRDGIKQSLIEDLCNASYGDIE